MRKFVEQNELMRFAKVFVETRINALDKDVRHCLQKPYAPFPAIAYCFATLNLLGALLSGEASRKAPSSEQSIEYMRRFMHYTEDQARLLMGIFRHKIVHLAEPKAISEYNGKRVIWQYWHDNAERHLKLTALEKPVQVQLTASWQIQADYQFEISIAQFVSDIASSVIEPGGYLHSLSSDTYLQDCFEKAISEIYDYRG
jgi:hypothetical protein